MNKETWKNDLHLAISQNMASVRVVQWLGTDFTSCSTLIKDWSRAGFDRVHKNEKYQNNILINFSGERNHAVRDENWSRLVLVTIPEKENR